MKKQILKKEAKKEEDSKQDTKIVLDLRAMIRKETYTKREDITSE